MREIEIRARMVATARLLDDRARDDVARSELALRMVVAEEAPSVPAADRCSRS